MRRVYCDIRRCVSCRSCEIACAVAHSLSDNLYQALQEEPRPKHLVRLTATRFAPFPLRCHHCEDAPCVDACKTGAMQRDLATGRVLVDAGKCVGCWMCVMVCPFGAVFPDTENGKALKCDLCAGHESPACVASCPTRALFFEEFEEFETEYKKRTERVGCR